MESPPEEYDPVAGLWNRLNSMEISKKLKKCFERVMALK